MMLFNPLFLDNLNASQGLLLGKSQKINNANYLFADIIKVMIDKDESTGDNGLKNIDLNNLFNNLTTEGKEIAFNKEQLLGLMDYVLSKGDNNSNSEETNFLFDPQNNSEEEQLNISVNITLNDLIKSLASISGEFAMNDNVNIQNTPAEIESMIKSGEVQEINIIFNNQIIKLNISELSSTSSESPIFKLNISTSNYKETEQIIADNPKNANIKTLNIFADSINLNDDVEGNDDQTIIINSHKFSQTSKGSDQKEVLDNNSKAISSENLDVKEKFIHDIKQNLDTSIKTTSIEESKLAPKAEFISENPVKSEKITAEVNNKNVNEKLQDVVVNSTKSDVTLKSETDLLSPDKKVKVNNSNIVPNKSDVNLESDINNKANKKEKNNSEYILSSVKILKNVSSNKSDNIEIAKVSDKFNISEKTESEKQNIITTEKIFKEKPVIKETFNLNQELKSEQKSTNPKSDFANQEKLFGNEKNIKNNDNFNRTNDQNEEYLSKKENTYELKTNNHQTPAKEENKSNVTEKKSVNETLVENKPVEKREAKSDSSSSNQSVNNYTESKEEESGFDSKQNTFSKNNEQNTQHTDKNNDENIFVKNEFKEKIIQEINIKNENVKTIKQTEILREVTRFLSKGEVKTIEFKIHPESLGRLKIQVEMIDNALKANIEVDSPAAKTMIENNISQLHQALQQNGLTYNSINITLSNQEQKSNKNIAQHKKRNNTEQNENPDLEKEESKIKKMGYNTLEFLA